MLTVMMSVVILMQMPAMSRRVDIDSTRGSMQHKRIHLRMYSWPKAHDKRTNDILVYQARYPSCCMHSTHEAVG